LNQAKSFGDILIVGINSDDSIKRLKGKDRPINCLDDRITVLAGLGSVDQLVSFEDDSPVKIIKAVKPDVFVKGGDYVPDLIPEAGLVKQLGGEVKIINFVKNRSTTRIIKRIRERTIGPAHNGDGMNYAKAAGVE
jgi:D-beta-D-heptose 7-phosphate kinase/D-beta-D-heptose 1-phosphate adenosyltransferase